jgi:hypothetical protein
VTERNPVRVFIYITFINLIFNCIHIRIKILHGTYSVFLKVRRIRGTGAASTRHRHRLGSSLLPISSLHATLQIPTVLAVSRVQPRSAPRKPVAPCPLRALQKPKSLEWVSKRFVSGIILETHSFSQTCIRSTFLSLNVGRVGSTLFNPPTSCERSIIFLLSLISLSAQSTQSKDHREARGLSRDRGITLLSNDSDHGSQGARRGERRTSLEMQVVFILLLILESGC